VENLASINCYFDLKTEKSGNRSLEAAFSKATAPQLIDGGSCYYTYHRTNSNYYQLTAIHDILCYPIKKLHLIFSVYLFSPCLTRMSIIYFNENVF